MRLPTYTPVGALAVAADWVRSVSRVLANGWTIQDQAAGEVKVIRWDGVTADAVDLSTTQLAKPVSVVVLGAVRVPDTGAVASGLLVTWQWLGDAKRSVRILALPDLGAAQWDVTLWIVGG